MVGTRRIELTDVDLDTKEVSVDFEFDTVLVNFNFRQSDLPMLEKLLIDLRENFKDLQEGS